MEINDVLRKIVEDEGFRERYLDAPEAALADLDLKEDDREALVSGLFPAENEERARLIRASNEAFGDKCPQRSRTI